MVNIDLFIFQQINNLAGRWTLLDNLGIFFAEYLAYASMLLLVLFFWKQKKVILLSLSAGVFAKYGLVELIRFFWQRPRPFIENNVNLLLEHNEASFPSGHAAIFFAISFVVYHYNKKAGLMFFIASFLIGVARVFVGIHWPTDIMGGALVGLFCGWLVLKIAKRF